jgi:hypothetical protein
VTICVTLFEDVSASTAKVCDFTPQELRDLVFQTTALGKTRLPLLKLAAYGSVLSINGSLRYDDNVKEIHGIEIDYDLERISFDKALKTLQKARLLALLYTSPSHTEAKPRWRILLPSSKALPPARRRQLAARVNGLFLGEIGPESFVLSQSFYYGKIKEGREHRAEWTAGDFIDLRDDLDEDAVYPKIAANGAVSAEQLARDPDLLEYGIREILPNNDLPYETADHRGWNDFGMAIHASFGGSPQGSEIFDVWSRKSSKYNRKVNTGKRWQHYNRSPANRVGAGKLMREINRTFGGYGWKDDFYKEHDAKAAKILGKLNGHDKTGKDKAEKEELLWVNAANVIPRAQEWLWFGHLGKGVLELITGIPGLGKSQVQISLIACVTAGLTWPDGTPPCTPAKVIMLTAEDSIDRTVVPRLIAAGANLANVVIVKMIRTDKKKRHFLLTEDLEKLEKLAHDLGSVVLITIDPITAYMGGRVDSHKATEVRSQLNPLQEFSDRTGIAVSAVTHPAKNVISQKAIDFFIGSQAFIAAGRIGHVCTPEYKDDEDGSSIRTDTVLFTHAKHSLSKSMPTLAYSIEEVRIKDDTVSGLPILVPRVAWTGEIIDITADEAVAASISHDAPAAKQNRDQDRLQNLLGELLREGPKPAKECEEASLAHGFTEKQLRKAREKVGIKTTKENGVWTWSLPLDAQIKKR